MVSLNKPYLHKPSPYHNNVLDAVAKLQRLTIGFVILNACLSICPQGTRLPLDGFSWNFLFGDFSKICRENYSFIKIDKNNRYVLWRPMYIYDISL